MALNASQSSPANLLSFDGASYRWLGSFTELKLYVEVGLKLSGNWNSPGGDTKVFTSDGDEFVLKWLKSKKLSIIKDNSDEFL